MNSSITVDLVRVAGVIDEEASVDVFRSKMYNLIAQLAAETDTIANAVSAVFDKYVGQSMAMPILCTFVLGELNAKPENHKVLSERITQYVRDNSQGEIKDKIQANPNSMFLVLKGKGGGVSRRADRLEKVSK